MSETMTREERVDALDQFARMTPPSTDASLPVPVGNAALPQIIGAQPITGGRREIRRVLAEIKELAAAAGENWFYRFPVRNKRENRTDYIEGPSIKLANAVQQIMGNIEVEVRVQDFGSSYMIYARAIDLEKGSALTRAFQQSKTAAKIGGGDDARRNDMALQIGQSKAIRNVICNMLQVYTDFAFEEAKGALVDKIGSNLPKWRERTVEAKIRGNGIDLKRVEAIIGRAAGDWLAPDVARVLAMVQSIEDGMASVDETFPPLRTEQPVEGVALDRFIEQNTPAKEPAEVQTAGAPEARQTPSEEAPAVDPDQAAAAHRLQVAAIDICLKLATNSQLTVEKRIEQLDDTVPALDGLSAALAQTIKQTAADVARGKMKPADARRYLEGMLK